MIKKVYRYILTLRDITANTFLTIYEQYYFKKLRKRNANTTFSLFSPNCYAGLIYHRLGLEFMSPTINLMFPSKKQYLKFVSNLKYYLSLDIIEVDDGRFSCPVGLIDDVELVFNHYHSFFEAQKAWDRRKQRVNYDNIFIIFDDYVDAEYDDLIKFNQIDCKGKMILTAKKYDVLENVIQIRKYAKNQVMYPYLTEKSR